MLSVKRSFSLEWSSFQRDGKKITFFRMKFQFPFRLSYYCHCSQIVLGGMPYLNMMSLVDS